MNMYSEWALEDGWGYCNIQPSITGKEVGLEEHGETRCRGGYEEQPFTGDWLEKQRLLVLQIQDAANVIDSLHTQHSC